MAQFQRFTREQITEVEIGLRNNAFALAVDLFPKGFRSGHHYFPLNHTRGDRHPGSMYVHISGDKAGGWWEAATDEKGNAMQLIAYAKGWDRRRDFPKTIRWAADWLALDLPEPKNVSGPPAGAAAGKPLSIAERGKMAKGIWLRGDAELKGTVADQYFISRGIDLRQLVKPPHAVRFDAEGRYYTAPKTFETMPTLLSLMINDDLKPLAVHRTYLTPDGQKYGGGRKDLSAKKIMGSYKGGFVPLSRGENGARYGEAKQNGLADTLAITEGLEDGLSAALIRPDWRVWMAGTLGNIGNLVWPEIAPELHIVAQNDTHPQAIAAFNKSVNALAKQSGGRPMFIHRPPAGIKDINDWLSASLGG